VLTYLPNLLFVPKLCLTFLTLLILSHTATAYCQEASRANPEQQRETDRNLLESGGFEILGQRGNFWSTHSKGPLGKWTIENGTVDIVGTYWMPAVGGQSLDLSGKQEHSGPSHKT